MAKRKKETQQDMLPLLWDDENQDDENEPETDDSGGERPVNGTDQISSSPDSDAADPTPAAPASPPDDDTGRDVDERPAAFGEHDAAGPDSDDRVESAEDELEEEAEDDPPPWDDPDDGNTGERDFDDEMTDAADAVEQPPLDTPEPEDDGPTDPVEHQPAPDPEEESVLKLDDLPLSVGETLLEARSARGLTIPQASQLTKIAASFIRHVEADQFERLPGLFYTEKHVCALCREYGIDPEPLLSQIRDRLGGMGGPGEPGRQMVVTTSETESASRVQYRLRTGHEPVHAWLSLNPATILVGTVALVVLVILIAFTVHQVRIRSEETGTTITDITPVDTGEDDPVDEDASDSTPVVDFEEFIVPQELPLKELAVPGN